MNDECQTLSSLSAEREAHRDTLATCRALARAYQRLVRADETYGHQARRLLRTLGLEATDNRVTFVAKELASVATCAKEGPCSPS